jgi:hypothetical protein
MGMTLKSNGNPVDIKQASSTAVLIGFVTGVLGVCSRSEMFFICVCVCFSVQAYDGNDAGM